MASDVLEFADHPSFRPALRSVGRWSAQLPSPSPTQMLDSLTIELVGASSALQAVMTRARKVAPTESTVLITGETGTGKELLARAIHKGSRRAEGPFVSVNCAAIPQTLIASELFGHERGAFTGALARRRGRFELAAGGTLFLDEVGELPMETQVTLLRVLQEREYERIGGSGSLPADVRVIAATNCDLLQAVAEGRFRSDLYYRLAVFPLEMPPLRAREGDIRLLAEHFVRRCARNAGKAILEIEPHALELLEMHSWPGNVRELQNVIERSVIVCEGETLTLDPTWVNSGRASGEPQPPSQTVVITPLRSTLDDIQREAILRALQACDWIIGGQKGAAALLGLKRTTLQARMQKLGIVTPQLRRAATSQLTSSVCSA
jgi:transcriptional regulator with GAF, ATPase, and Fis domain